MSYEWVGWCREGESNPHSPFGPADFKSAASANFAIPAGVYSSLANRCGNGFVLTLDFSPRCGKQSCATAAEFDEHGIPGPKIALRRNYALISGRLFAFCTGTPIRSLMSSSTTTTPSILFSSVRYGVMRSL